MLRAVVLATAIVIAAACSSPAETDPYVTPPPITVPGSVANADVIPSGESEIVTVRRQQDLSEIEASFQNREGCPHDETDLVFWDNPSTWPSNSIPTSGDVVLPDNTKVLLRRCGSNNGVWGVFDSIMVPSSSQLIFNDQDITLQTHGMIVEGKLRIGSPSCRLHSNIEIELFGSKSEFNFQITSFLEDISKGVVAKNGGEIDIHGKRYHPTWTRLASTLTAGSSFIRLQDEVNWEVGQEIMVTTTIWRDEENNQNEVFTITGVDASRSILEISPAAQYLHYAGSEYQAEVGLLTRRIKVKSNSAEDGFGGHTAIGPGGQGRFSGVEAFNLGQTNQLGRYPFHFHLIGDYGYQFMQDCSIRKSNYRCVSVHGTNNVTLSRNVAFDVTGHCFYLEDGVEEYNNFEYNLAAFIHTIGDPAGALAGGQSGETICTGCTPSDGFYHATYSPEDLLIPTDVAASPFYITNANNRFVGNAASGGWSGFIFPNLAGPVGLFKDSIVANNKAPENRPLLEFDGNTAHSEGYFWGRGSCIYIGGEFGYADAAKTKLIYKTGRNNRKTYNEAGQAEDFMIFNNTKTFLCERGVNHWGDTFETYNTEVHDTSRGSVCFGRCHFKNALFNGLSQNSNGNGDFSKNWGFQFYDTSVRIILSDIIFRNFAHGSGSEYGWNGVNALLLMTHSNVFKPQFINAAINITFDNVPVDKTLACKSIPCQDISSETGSARVSNMLDADGSVTQRGYPAIIGSHVPFWNVSNDCDLDSNMNLWVCRKNKDGKEREIVWVNVIVSNYMVFSDPDNGNIIGSVSIFGTEGQNNFLQTKNPGITGISEKGWNIRYDEGSPMEWLFERVQIPRGHFIVLSMPYPENTQFNVQIEVKWGNPSGYTIKVPRAGSLDQIAYPTEDLNPPEEFECLIAWPNADFCWNTGGWGPRWFFDGTHLFLRVVDIHFYTRINQGYISEPYFERSGVRIPTIQYGYRWRITASCPGSETSAPGLNGNPVQFCSVPDNQPGNIGNLGYLDTIDSPIPFPDPVNELGCYNFEPGLRVELFHSLNLGSVLPDMTNFVYDQTTVVDSVIWNGFSGNLPVFDSAYYNNYALRITAALRVPVNGEYFFYLISDDGSKLYINDQLVVDNDGLHSTKEETGAIELNEGFVDMRVEFFQKGGGASLMILWSGAGFLKRPIASDLACAPPEFGAVMAPAPPPQPKPSDLGDVNLDGEVNIADVVVLIAILIQDVDVSSDVFAQANLAGGTTLNIQDVVSLIDLVV